MAAKDKREQNKSAQRKDRNSASKQAPKIKVIESGRPEQEAPIAPQGERPAGKETARRKQREEYRHGGIPLGSDPRE